MTKITYSAEASDDLDDIYNYSLEQWNVFQADAYVAGIFRAIALIENFTGIGSRGSPSGDQVRRIRHESHNIYYRQTSSGDIRILRLMHIRRRVSPEILADID